MPNAKIDLTSNSLIECILKRKGGSTVTLGHKHATQRTYQFKPLDEKDPASPHLCDVQHEDDYALFLSVREGYRRYLPGKTEPVSVIPAANTELDKDKFKNQFDDLLSVNAETIDNEWLQQFSSDVLKISPKAKAKLTEYLKKTYGKELDGVPAANTVIREILRCRIAEERAADEQLKLAGAGDTGSGEGDDSGDVGQNDQTGNTGDQDQ